MKVKEDSEKIGLKLNIQKMKIKMTTQMRAQIPPVRRQKNVLYAEYIMWNARLDEVQARIKIARRNISNLRYADDITLMG